MFGGLDLKGSTATTKEVPSNSEDQTPKGNGVADTTTSAFSFLSSLTTTVPPTPAVAKPRPATTSSSFSFLNTSSTASAEPKNVDHDIEPSAIVAPVSSAFGFLASQATVSAPPAPGTNTITDAPPPSFSASPFDFLQQKAPTQDNAPPPPPPPPGGASPVVSDDLLSVGANMMSAAQQPAGSGMVFAATATKKAVKKRSRTAKIGAGTTPMAAVTPVSLPPPAAMLSAPIEGSSISRSVSEDSNKLAEAASEASRRAEEFIYSKFQAEATAAVPPALESVRSEDDDVIIAAKAAAAEAKQLQHQQQKKAPSFTNLFRGRSPTPKPVATGNGTKPATAVDRLQKEQEEAKRAMAERQLHMQNNASMADAATISTSSFQPPVVSVSARSSTAPKVFSTAASVPATNPFGLSDVLSMHQTPTDEFDKILQDFETQVTANMDQLTRLNAQKRVFLEERASVTGRMQLARSDAENCQNQQAAAADAEDFDTAAQLSEMIQEYEQEQARCKGKLDTIDATIVEIDKQVAITTTTVEKLYQGLQGKLQTLKEAQDDDADAAVSLEKFSLIAKQLSTENERLQQDFKHLMRDSELVAEERNELEKAISEQSGEYEKLRDQARSQLQETEAAIEELRKQLDTKQREAARLRTEAAGHDESVLRVRVKFARQINRVQKKEMTIQDNKDEWESEKRAYDLQKEAHDATVQAHSEALLAKDMLADSVKKQISHSETYGLIVASEIKSLTLEKSVAADASLQAEMVRCQGIVRKYQVEFDNAKAAVSSLEREIEFLVNDIPVFEETKKVAAARRDFKAASKASKDIKDATARLGVAQSELQGEATDRLNAAEAELSVAKEKLQLAQEMALAQEKECVIGIMVEWAETLKRLATAVKELEDGVGVHAATKYCLKAQMKAIRTQGEAYGAKYGGWDELLVDFEAVDDGPYEECNGDHDLPDESVRGVAEEAASAEVMPTQADEGENDDAASTGRMRQFLTVTAQLKDVEQALEEAAAAEDYEKAAVLDERLQELLVLVERLNLTDNEMEQALAMELATTSEDDEQQETGAPASPQNEEEGAGDVARSESDENVSAGQDVVGACSSIETGASVDEEVEGANEEVSPAAAGTDADNMEELPKEEEDANGLEKSGSDAEEADPDDDSDVPIANGRIDE